MQIQINTDHNIAGHEALSAHVTEVVESALSRFSNHITRVEVHLSDENADKKSGNDKRCLMEVRLEHHQPIAATDHAASCGSGCSWRRPQTDQTHREHTGPRCAFKLDSVAWGLRISFWDRKRQTTRHLHVLYGYGCACQG